VALSPAQRAWVAAHQPRFGPERDYGPFVFQRADGVIDGLSVDILRQLQARTGLVLRTAPAASLQRQLDAVRAGQLDLLASLRPTPERAAYLRFTQAYVSVPALLVRRSADARVGLDDLAGQAVAVGQGYAVEPVLSQRYPQVRWLPLPDDVAGLQALARGEVAAAVADAASLAFIRRQHGLSGLAGSGEVGFDYALSFAVRADWPELVDILDAGIRSLSLAERQAVLERWLPPPEQPTPATRAPMATRLALALLALALGVAGWMAWQRRASAGTGR
jgi:ABC-type amino acid transport substrate-binding protein